MSDVHSLLSVKDLVKDKPIFVTSNSTVLDVASKMKKNKITSVLVKDTSGEIVGIVTGSDIVYKIVASKENPSKAKVEKIMTKNLLSIEGNESMFKARQIMLDNKVRHLIVTNSGKQIGIVTSKEVLGR